MHDASGCHFLLKKVDEIYEKNPLPVGENPVVFPCEIALEERQKVIQLALVFAPLNCKEPRRNFWTRDTDIWSRNRASPQSTLPKEIKA